MELSWNAGWNKFKEIGKVYYYTVRQGKEPRHGCLILEVYFKLQSDKCLY